MKNQVLISDGGVDRLLVCPGCKQKTMCHIDFVSWDAGNHTVTCVIECPICNQGKINRKEAITAVEDIFSVEEWNKIIGEIVDDMAE